LARNKSNGRPKKGKQMIIYTERKTTCGEAVDGMYPTHATV